MECRQPLEAGKIKERESSLKCRGWISTVNTPTLTTETEFGFLTSRGVKQLISYLCVCKPLICHSAQWLLTWGLGQSEFSKVSFHFRLDNTLPPFKHNFLLISNVTLLHCSMKSTSHTSWELLFIYFSHYIVKSLSTGISF